VGTIDRGLSTAPKLINFRPNPKPYQAFDRAWISLAAFNDEKLHFSVLK
jgi:hypothetical protein